MSDKTPSQGQIDFSEAFNEERKMELFVSENIISCESAVISMMCSHYLFESVEFHQNYEDLFCKEDEDREVEIHCEVEWDIDEPETDEDELPPSEFDITVAVSSINDDVICDAISDEYGFCVKSLEFSSDYDPEFIEPIAFYSVSDFLYRKLKDKGEIVTEMLGKYIWGRCEFGQLISQDYVIQQIFKEFDDKFKDQD